MGSSLINNPIGYSQDPWGNANDGAYITGGDSVFDDDDVIVFTVQKVNHDGTFDNQTQIMGIEVYDNAADYVNGVPKYTYELEKTGGWGWGNNTGSGDVSTSVHNMGDAYLHFPADGFVSSDPGAPDLDYLFLAPGVDLSEATRFGSRMSKPSTIMKTAPLQAARSATGSLPPATTCLPKMKLPPRFV
ncbi:hypothetical protein [Roseobacter sp. TSBP12]|uniref:hypothetical protein n=1 Tax=Roseobacter sp. TSBP12 TaxID=1236613 RepID=UPI001D02C85D|nr:hypothetical protein [Roseobacter sp. TSBP12]